MLTPHLRVVTLAHLFHHRAHFAVFLCEEQEHTAQAVEAGLDRIQGANRFYAQLLDCIWHGGLRGKRYASLLQPESLGCRTDVKTSQLGLGEMRQLATMWPCVSLPNRVRSRRVRRKQARLGSCASNIQPGCSPVSGLWRFSRGGAGLEAWPSVCSMWGKRCNR